MVLPQKVVEHKHLEIAKFQIIKRVLLELGTSTRSLARVKRVPNLTSNGQTIPTLQSTSTLLSAISESKEAVL
jgi:hypothetical protein